ncbi:hypothetical protein [Turicimonas muris]|uniref:hypothetical protein n=1 Tax=Turicimonas muris TaxID=1796652 RepID=UPI00349FE99B
MHSGGYAVFTVMFLIVVGSAFVIGSGNAAFFCFAPMIPDIAVLEAAREGQTLKTSRPTRAEQEAFVRAWRNRY